MQRLGLAAGNFRPQFSFAGIRNLLRDTKAEIGEVAVRISGKGARTADRYVLQHHLRIRQCGGAFGRMTGGFPGMTGGQNLRILLSSFFHQAGQGCGPWRVLHPFHALL